MCRLSAASMNFFLDISFFFVLLFYFWQNFVFDFIPIVFSLLLLLLVNFFLLYYTEKRFCFTFIFVRIVLKKIRQQVETTSNGFFSLLLPLAIFSVTLITVPDLCTKQQTLFTFLCILIYPYTFKVILFIYSNWKWKKKNKKKQKWFQSLGNIIFDDPTATPLKYSKKKTLKYTLIHMEKMKILEKCVLSVGFLLRWECFVRYCFFLRMYYNEQLFLWQ